MLKVETNKYKLAYFIKFLADSFFYPFFGLYLASIGKTEKEIGLVLMFIPLIAVVINPIWNYFAKNVNYNRTFMIIFSVIEALSIFLLMLFVELYIVIIIAVVISIVGQPVFSMIEGYTAAFSVNENKDYSVIRLFGSIGYALGIMISGSLIVKTSYQLIMILTSLFLVIVSVMFILIKPLELKEEENQKGSVKQLFNNKNFILFFFFYIITLASIFGGESFWGLYLEQRNIDAQTFGWLGFIAYGLEVLILILLSKYGEKIKISVIMVSIVILNSLRYLIFAFDMSFPFLIIHSITRAYIMGSFLYLIVRYLNKYVKRHNFTLALIIVNSAKSIFQAVITLVGGVVIETYNYKLFYIGVALISATALFFVKYQQGSDDYVIITKENN